MKKIILLFLSFSIVFGLGACAKKQSTNSDTQPNEVETLKEVPSYFYKNYEKAEFDKFNSFASDNGLGNTMIYMYGKFDEITEFTVNGYTGYISEFIDEDGNSWSCEVGLENYDDKEDYDSIVGSDVMILANYQGYSGTKEMPAIVIKGIYDRTTGNTLYPMYYTLLGLEEIYADGSTDNSSSIISESENDNPTDVTNEEEIEEVESDIQLVDGMRPEFKEAMDSYEEFYSEYCDLYKKYSENSSDLTILAEYYALLGKMDDMDKKFDAWDGDLNDAEYKYYLEVQSRVTQKLASIV